jgi:hypothetical protein
VDIERNFAAWMIAGGHRAVDPAEARAQMHRRALAEARTVVRTGPGLIARLAVATVIALRTATGTVTALRSAPRPVEPACCPA